MKIVKDILDTKGRQIWSVGPDFSVFEALQLMADKGIGALLVMNGDLCVGIMSERDYARKVVLMGRASKDVPVRDIMTPRVLFVKPDQTVEKCMALMIEKRVRHLPVMENEKVAGLISIGDVVRAVIAEKQLIIQELEDYIWGRR
jgi:CBS domain-containing protein